MERRLFVLSSSGVAVTALAGCLSSGESPPDDPRERAGWYVNEGAESSAAYVDEVLSLAASESDGQDGFDVGLDYKLQDGGASTPDDAEFRCNMTALSVFESVFADADVRVNMALIEAIIDTVDQQGQEAERTVQQVQMLREDAEAINWENIGPDQIPVNAEYYDFNPNYYL